MPSGFLRALGRTSADPMSSGNGCAEWHTITINSAKAQVGAPLSRLRRPAQLGARRATRSRAQGEERRGQKGRGGEAEGLPPSREDVHSNRHWCSVSPLHTLSTTLRGPYTAIPASRNWAASTTRTTARLSSSWPVENMSSV